MRLQNKYVAVTGACSEAGQAIAAAFAAEGACVTISTNLTESAGALKESLSGRPGRVEICSADSALNAAEYAVKVFGSLDVLINCPEYTDDGAGIAQTEDAALEDAMEACLNGPMQTMRSAAAYFQKAKKAGTIINVVSSSLSGGLSGCAANAALIAMTRNMTFMYMPKNIRCNLIDINGSDFGDAAQIALFLASDEAAYHYRSDGIRCNAIAPGSITTKITSSMGKPDLSGMMRSMKVMKGRPKKSGTADDIAQLVLFLAGDASSHVNGAVIPIDGGWDTM